MILSNRPPGATHAHPTPALPVPERECRIRYHNRVSLNPLYLDVLDLIAELELPSPRGGGVSGNVLSV